MCFIRFVLLFRFIALAWAEAPHETPVRVPAPANRVASLFVAQSFVNELLAKYVKSPLVQNLKIDFDKLQDSVFLRGQVNVPVEELRAINLDPALGAFRFQVSLRLRSTPSGYLIVEFPLSETYFYPASSKDPRDRIIVPVQMLSLALASVRGYLAALSGDFSGFDRRTQKLKVLLHEVDRSIAHTQNQDALSELKNQREAYRLQLAAVPIERKQLEGLAKQVEHFLGFTGEKELNLNDELGANRNTLILKIKLAQIAPYLQGVTLGGVRLIHDKIDAGGENFLAIDVNSDLARPLPPREHSNQPRTAMAAPPFLVMRLNQSLFEAESLVKAEQAAMGGKLKDVAMELKDDGLHVTGAYKAWLFSVPFETVVDFVSTTVDQFEVRMRDFKVAGLDLEFLSKFILESIKQRLDQRLHGICQFEYAGTEKDHSRVLRVTIEPKALIPAFPDLHLTSVDVRDHEFLMKLGRPL